MELQLKKVFKNVETGKLAQRIYETVNSGDKLTVNKDFIARKCYQVNERQKTLFNEIEIVSYTEFYPAKFINTLNKLKPNSIQHSLDEFMQELIELLMKSVEERWDLEKFHVVYHSSGNDSRIMSSILSRLAKKNGPEWLGEILFIAWEPEGELAENIMKYHGFNTEKQFAIYKKGIAHSDFYLSDLVFKDAYKRLNGYQTIPYNNFYSSIKYMQSVGKLPKSTSQLQIWTGELFNEIFMMLGGGKDNLIDNFLTRWYNSYYTERTGALKGNYHWLLLDTNVLKVLIESEIKWKGNLRHLIVEALDPALAKFTRLTDSARTRFMYPKLSLDIMKKVQSDYDKSWYGKNIKPGKKIIGQVCHSGTWGFWSSASLIEYLKNKGVEIS